MQPLKAANYGFSRLPILAGIVLLAVPGYSQYYSNDITPPSANSGKLQGASSGKQVGGGSNSHAYLLSGNALSAVDLHPATGYYSSMATSTDGTDQGLQWLQFGWHPCYEMVRFFVLRRGSSPQRIQLLLLHQRG